ncbi:MAG: hypothetical protein FJ152_08785 [Firmicutes bacterium]|nr:hypothetical protein [Bacillota bacterium]
MKRYPDRFTLAQTEIAVFSGEGECLEGAWPLAAKTKSDSKTGAGLLKCGSSLPFGYLQECCDTFQLVLCFSATFFCGLKFFAFYRAI